MSEPKTLESVEEFFFGAPPYASYVLPADMKIVEQLYGRSNDNRIDGHCPNCNKMTTFVIKGQHVPNGDDWDNIRKRNAYDYCKIICVRDHNHTINYWFWMRRMTIEKVGQHPSLATISNDEVAQYRKGMSKVDSQEFHKAIGLAAHGVGVGSFVYLRRVFERMVYGRFEEFKAAEGWKDEDFYGLRMNEKVQFLKGHLPAFLVENAKIYSILSIGIHELDEATCLQYFDLMKHSIIIILEEDKRKKEELAMRSKFSNLIAKFDPEKA
ncbi:hypothetical protein LMG31506_03019 [Cupriavidus yeoncheonensis]|uniref:Uncharacterized protein n=1 Tax=Cupriavidus yeoncheonensis TaxID=1462994 RepID=A0A916IUH0_9BURK|nr:hypothetical protein [Cupriavidus yeoncheonensis]CAG2144497.1 hypothetical protein LMG31506_03019 [Cupriavidus yeoncheonensis]